MKKRYTCLLLTVAITISLGPSPLAATPPESSEPSSWAAETVQEAIDFGIVPEHLQNNWQQNLSRGEFAELAIWFLAAQYGYAGKAGLSMEMFFEDYLDKHFDPNGLPFSKDNFLIEPASSQDAFYSWRGILSDYANFFDDVDPYSVYINLAYLMGVVRGRGERCFDPNGTITRQEAATMLARTYEIYGVLELQEETNPFSDSKQIAPWARESVEVLHSWDVLQGNENASFLPQDHYSREQGVVTFMRLYYNMPISRYHGTVAPLLSYAETVERCLNESGPYPHVLYREETKLGTILYLNYSGVMSPPSPAIFIIYPDSTYVRINNAPHDPTNFQFTEDNNKLIFFSEHQGTCYILDLRAGILKPDKK